MRKEMHRSTVLFSHVLPKTGVQNEISMKVWIHIAFESDILYICQFQMTNIHNENVPSNW